MDAASIAYQIYFFCTQWLLLRPMAKVIKLLVAIGSTYGSIEEVERQINVDPGIPIANPTISFWQEPPHKTLSKHQSPELRDEVDVLIIGSGITSASLAHHLLSSDRDISVTVIEARTLTSGATGRNGGHIIEIPFEDYELLKVIYGKEPAKKLLRFYLSHLPSIKKFCDEVLDEDARTASQIREVQAVLAIYDEKRWDEVRESFKVFLNDFPEQQGRWEEWTGEAARKKFNMPSLAGAITGPSGAIWPYRFVTRTFEHLLAAHPDRLRIETATPAHSVSVNPPTGTQPRRYTCSTPRGAIHARSVVHATNGHAAHLLPRMRGRIFPFRGQMTAQSLYGEMHGDSSSGGSKDGEDGGKDATASDPGLASHARSWILRYGRGFDYMTRDPRTGDFYLGGGFAQADRAGLVDIACVRDDEHSRLALAHLKGVLPLLFREGGRQGGEGEEGEQESQPPVAVVKRAWSGIMGYSCDGRAWVGRVPDSISERKGAQGKEGGEWIAAGFCGSGMVCCWRSGEALAAMMLGRDPPEDFPEVLLMSDARYKAADLKDVALFLKDL